MLTKFYGMLIAIFLNNICNNSHSQIIEFFFHFSYYRFFFFYKIPHFFTRHILIPYKQLENRSQIPTTAQRILNSKYNRHLYTQFINK